MEEPTNCSVIPGKKLSLDVKLGRKKILGPNKEDNLKGSVK
jgi:hypothetical protein